ncbi:MAG: methyltransferase domain-containing protein, partial [Candidatus Aminicenantes bacterium]|nr:methyltransferase domain-containing protein [Candidatus Aminicenantes bacterium]
GRFTVRLARRVGPSGLVYANDIDRDALDYLAQRCRANDLGNVKIITGELHEPGFPPQSLDMAFMINVYNSLEDPVRYLRNIAPALKPGGTLAIVLVDPVKFPGIPPRSATREQFLASAEKAGYSLEKEETFLIHDGIYVLRPKRKA